MATDVKSDKIDTQSQNKSEKGLTVLAGAIIISGILWVLLFIFIFLSIDRTKYSIDPINGLVRIVGAMIIVFLFDTLFNKRADSKKEIKTVKDWAYTFVMAIAILILSMILGFFQA